MTAQIEQAIASRGASFVSQKDAATCGIASGANTSQWAPQASVAPAPEAPLVMRIAVILILSVLALGAACLAVPGPLPGDVGATLALQSAFGASPEWAAWLTDTAKPPLVAVVVIAGAGLAWLMAGWRAALAVPVAFGFGWLIDKVLRAVIFAPRPTPDLVAVATNSSSSGLPSSFGLVYGSVFGAVLFAAASGKMALALRGVAVALLIAGAAARMVLGGHWFSQMLVSTLLGLLAAMSAIALLNLAGRRGWARTK